MQQKCIKQNSELNNKIYNIHCNTLKLFNKTVATNKLKLLELFYQYFGIRTNILFHL